MNYVISCFFIITLLALRIDISARLTKAMWLCDRHRQTPARDAVLLGCLNSSYAVRLGYRSGRKAPVRNGEHRSSASQVGAFRGNDRMTIC